MSGVRIDLHTHSNLSDGTSGPAELVAEGARAGLAVLALTDHDTVAGWEEAAAAAVQHGIALVRGIEVSTMHGGRSVHLLAYLPDPRHPGLGAALTTVLEARVRRLPKIIARLRESGIDLDESDVRQASFDAVAPGRPHIADALVAVGAATDRSDAMQRMLAPGTPGWVPRTALALTEAVDLIRAAGGAAVLAHPWGRSARSVLDAATIADLAHRGMVGIEVDHPDHSTAHRRELRALARELDLVVTGSSDHHGTGKVGHALGSETTAPEEYDRLIEAATTAGAESGRRPPVVVG